MARPVEAALVAAVALAASTPAMAADRQQISIAPGRLGDAAIALGRQTGSSIGMSDQSLAGIATPHIHGRIGVETALRRLLRGTGAQAVRINDHSWRIVRVRTVSRPAVATPASTAPAAEPELAEIVVTASKRDTPLLRYAGMVDTIDTRLFASGQAASGTASLLSRIASLSSTHAGSGRNKLFIRAIADSGVAGPTQATTGQYLGDMRLNYAAPDPDLKLYDMRGVEVLEGPQGTLYGAGSLGGIIRLIPNVPNLGEWSGQAGAGLSTTRHGDPGGDLSATINMPIVAEKIALRVVGYGGQDGGYIDNIGRDADDAPHAGRDVNRVRTHGGRAALRIAPNEAWTIDLNALYQRIEGDDAQYASADQDRLERATAVAQPYSSNYLLFNARVEKQWDSLRFVSSTGYVRHIIDESYDATQPDGPPALFRQRNKVGIFSTENRLVRDLDNGLGWVLGVSYLESTSNIRRSLTSYGTQAFQPQIIPGVAMIGRGRPATTTGVENRVKEATLFGEASFEPLPGLVATFGGRLTNSRLSGNAIDPIAALSASDLRLAEAQAKRNETIFLPSFSLLTDAIPDITVYARFQQGFRPGGLAVDDQRIDRFRNDRVSTLEFGFRKGVPGRDALALSANAAYTDWDDIQADVTDRIGMPSTTNIGDGRIYTLEGRVVLRPIASLTLDGSIIYNDSRLSQPAQYVKMLADTDRTVTLPNVANLGGRFGIDYRARIGADLGLHLSGSARYVGKSRVGVGPILGRKQGDYVDTAASASLSRGSMEVSLSLTNLLDTTGNRFSLGTPFDLRTDYHTPLRPRTVRLGVDLAF